MKNKYLKFFKENVLEIIISFFSLIFSFWLMFSTFSYKNGFMLISTKAWSDFASHIPLIRSFSLGNNFPPQYPIFPGEPIRYHYLFFLLVGMLERIGLRIDWAMNLPSAVSFLVLMLMIYFFAKELFKSKTVGVLSLIFFLFNGSFSFIEFFKLHPLSLNTVNDIITNRTFPSFGPYDGKIVSAFWNLNIYTNQRHLALPLAILLFIVFLLIKYQKRKKNIPWYLIIIFSIIVGVMPLLHSSVFLMIIVVLIILFFLFPYERKSTFLVLLIGSLLSLPRVLFLKQSSTYLPHLQLGYLIAGQLSLSNFLYYWFMNLGLSLVLIPLGFLYSDKLEKKVLAAFFSLFLIGNMFQFSPEMAGNHKFFNAFLIVGNMFSAFLLVKIWQKFKYLRITVLLIGFIMIFSGIIDFFPIKNDNFIYISDYPINQDIQWIIKNTPKDAIFLNTVYLYDNASLAGRKIFMGWPYFSWSLGYNTDLRDALMKQMFSTPDKKTLCTMLMDNKINYIEINGNNLNDPDSAKLSPIMQSGLTPIYNDYQTNYKIYSVLENCRNI